MSSELATIGARRLRPATVEGNQQHNARLLAEQTERDRRNFPIPGLSRETFANYRSATGTIGDVGGAAVRVKGKPDATLAAQVQRPVVDAKLAAVPAEPPVRNDAPKGTFKPGGNGLG